MKQCPLRMKMPNAFKIFGIRREERWLAIVALLVFATFNALLISAHWKAYTLGAHGGFYSLFTTRYMLSGYDCWSWLTVSEGRVLFDTARHPLYLTFLYPLFWLNSWFVDTGNTNCAVFLIAAVVVLAAVYSAIFMYRIAREVMALPRGESYLLTAFLFSFAHVLVPSFAPDHFIISMFLLLLTLYVVGMSMRRGLPLRPWQGFVLAFFTCGMAASNVVKTYLAGLFANGRRFFAWRYLLVAVVLPVVLLAAIQRVQYHYIELPLKQKNEHVVRANAHKHNKVHHLAEQRSRWRAQNDMKPAGDGILKLMDFDTPRWPTVVDNFFGEGFQLHRDHLLEDALVSRNEFIPYRHAISYVVEALLVVLLAVGIWCGRRQRLMQLALLWMGCDVGLNLVLGFGINEVYIMTTGWAFIVPIATGYVLLHLPGQGRRLARLGVLLLTLYLWAWNGGLAMSYLLK